MADLNKLFLFFLCLLLGACGVKGRPVPPQNPPPLGRGAPTYKETKKKKSPPSAASPVTDDKEEP